MKISHKVKKILSLVSAFLIMLVLGTLYTLGAVTPYITSYLYYQGDLEITNTKLSFLFLAQVVCVDLGMIISTFFSSYLSNKVTAIIALLGFIATIFITSFLTQFWGFLVFYGILYGTFIGFGYLAPLKNCYEYWADQKGLCAGVCMMGFGLSSVIFNQIFQFLINPDNAPLDSNHQFPKQVAEHLPQALKIICAFYFAIGLLGVLIMLPKKRQEKQDESLLSSENIQEVYQQSPLTFKNIINRKLHLMILTFTCTLPFGLFVAYSYKQYGLNYIDDDHFITLVGSLGSLANGTSRFFWGFLLDRVSYKTILIIINGVLFICCALINFIAQVKALFMIIVILTYFCYGGVYSVSPTLTVRIMGQKAGTKIYPLVFFGLAISVIFEFILHYFLVLEFGLNGFKYCFAIFACTQVFGLVLSALINYQFDQKENQLIKKSIKK